MDLITILKGELTEYSSMPFWSWNNELEIPELIRQINEFKKVGIDSFIMHARTGLKTEYLGEKWFDCIEACLKEAKRLDMRAWAYDENGWPSGFAGGILLKDEKNLVRQLKYKVQKEFDPAALVYIFNGGRAERVYAPQLGAEYHCVYIEPHYNYADILNPAVAEKFIELTHERYYRRFSKYFGKELAGFFTDEPQYFRHGFPYSVILPEEYKKEYGEDLADSLIYLFIDCKESGAFRYKYYFLLNKLYTRFYKRLYDWCNEHGCMLTGHTVEEPLLSTQLWCCAGAMPSYQYEHIPAIDWLARQIGNVQSPKQAGSVAQQFGKKRVLTETFGCSGWDTTPRELRRIAEFQYVLGVNSMCQHLVSYSLKGQAKCDYPPSFSRHNAWIAHSKIFNDYFKRLSYILSNTRECAEVLVIHPMHDAYRTYRRDTDYESVKDLEESFLALSTLLTERGVQFHYGDEWILSRSASVDGSRIKVGLNEYTYIVIPQIKSIDSSTLKLIKEFENNGGKVCLAGASPELADAYMPIPPVCGNCRIEDLPAVRFGANVPSRLIFSRRKGDIGEFLYIYNTSPDTDVSAELSGGYRVLDLEKCEIKDGVFPLTVPAMGSVMLIMDDKAMPVPAQKKGRAEDITAQFRFEKATDNCLDLDFVSVSKDGVNFDPPEYIHSANERLIKEEYGGKLWLKYTFNVKQKPKNLRLLAEQLLYNEVTLNGTKLDLYQSGWDVFFSEADISACVKTGENVLIACIDYVIGRDVRHVLFDKGVMESLKNCLVIDTEIETVYILGQFEVNEQREVVTDTLIKNISGIQNQGFPHFAGTITFSAETYVENTNKILKLFGRFMTARILVNGREAGTMVLSDTMDLSEYLRPGHNIITVSLVSSMRNMIGPLHYAPEIDPKDVGHYHFDFRGTWQGSSAPDFTPVYRTVNFGIDKAVLEDIL